MGTGRFNVRAPIRSILDYWCFRAVRSAKNRRQRGQPEELFAGLDHRSSSGNEDHPEAEAAALVTPNCRRSSKLTHFLTHLHGYPKITCLNTTDYLADAADLKFAGTKVLWGFDSPSRHQIQALLVQSVCVDGWRCRKAPNTPRDRRSQLANVGGTQKEVERRTFSGEPKAQRIVTQLRASYSMRARAVFIKWHSKDAVYRQEPTHL